MEESSDSRAGQVNHVTADSVAVVVGDTVWEICPNGIEARRVIRDGGIVVAVDLDAWDLRSAESGLCDIAKCYWSKERADAEFERTNGR